MFHFRITHLITFLLLCTTGIHYVAAEPRQALVSSRLQNLVDATATSQQDELNQFIDIILVDRVNRDINTLIQAHGGDSKYRLKNKQQVRIHRNRLKKLLDSLPQGVTARLSYPHSENAVTSQGVALTGAEDMQNLNTSGLNVKIGVIDLGFSSLSASQASGDLPVAISLVDYTGTGTGGTNHGTIVAEIVHDMAPAAELYLAKIGTDLELEVAVNDMIANGIQVINHSVAWFGAAFYDGTGPICDVTNTADTAGLVWVNAAGNSRNEHYLGDFTDTNGNLFHEFTAGQDYNTISATAGVSYTLALNWDDYITQNRVDYNLYVYDGDPTAGGSIIAQSTNAQFAGFPYPHELLTYTSPGTATHYIVVKKRNAATANLPLTLFTPNKNLGIRTQSSSLTQPADCNAVLSVGATNLSDAAEGFSSEGPTTDGRNKPDVSGPDRVMTSLNSSFAGTSASSPHVAGAAALLIQQNPSLDHGAIKNLLISDSQDVHTSGFDFRTGHGRISLDADLDGFNHDADNCTLVYNLTQDDLDSDGVGDACEPPVITGFWPGKATAGEFIFVFGSYFTSNSTVAVNGINASLVQFVSDNMLIFVLPQGDTNGLIEVSNDNGTGSSTTAFGIQLSGLQITGIWPSVATTGDVIFVFGNGFVPDETQVSIAATNIPLVQIVDDQLLLLMLPPGLTSSTVTITTPLDNVTSTTTLTIN